MSDGKEFGQIDLDEHRSIMFREVFWEGTQRFDIRIAWDAKFTRKGVVVPSSRMLEFAEIVQRMAQYLSGAKTPSEKPKS